MIGVHNETAGLDREVTFASAGPDDLDRFQKVVWDSVNIGDERQEISKSVGLGFALL